MTSTADSPSPSKPPWQFSQRKLLLLITCVAIFLGSGSQSLRVGYLFAGLVIISWSCAALIRQNISTFHFFLILTCVGLFLAIFVPDLRSGQRYDTGIVALRVVDAETNQPIAGAILVLYPNGNSQFLVPATTDKQGEVRIAATFKAVETEQGWAGRVTYIFTQDTEVDISAPGYETTVFSWNSWNKEEFRPANVPPAIPVEIRLTPSQGD